MTAKNIIRLASQTDHAAMLEIYAPYVIDTPVTFDYEVPTLAEFSGRITNISAHYPCLVYEVNGAIAGYAYSGIHRVKAAYQWSTELTVYIDKAYHGKGVAMALYRALLAMLKLQGFINVYAGVVVPNEQSEKFHLKAGFTGIGLFEKIGYKFNRWHDLKFFQLVLNEHSQNAVAPIPITEIENTLAFRKILEMSITD